MRVRMQQPEHPASIKTAEAAGEAAVRSAGRWQVIKGAWSAEFRQALERTRGNVELAVALAATMIFAD